MRSLLDLMKFRAFHGCYDLEQQVGNRFTVDLEITAELGEVASEDCVEKAVNYLDHFWNQVFLYWKGGDYTTDNSLMERYIRPLANERKNSLFFGSDKMACVSAAYYSVVST